MAQPHIYSDDLVLSAVDIEELFVILKDILEVLVSMDQQLGSLMSEDQPHVFVNENDN